MALNLLRAAGIWLGMVVFALAGATEPAAVRANEQIALEKAALAVMAGIVPHAPAPKSPVKISSPAGNALWGLFFGDSQVAALVAINADGPNADSGAELCLLLWQDRWRFKQHVGKVSTEAASRGQTDWTLILHEAQNTFYVLSRLELYPAGDHLSWLCEAKTHSLKPTGWPTDAIPSLSGDLITFTSQEKPGYTPVIRDIRRITAEGLVRVALLKDEYSAEHHLLHATVSAWDPLTAKSVTWNVWKKAPAYDPHHDVYALCLNETHKDGGTFLEDALIEFDWGDASPTGNVAAAFVLWRLTGVHANALRGNWNNDDHAQIQIPQSATVTGLPKAVERFTWPEPGVGR